MTGFGGFERDLCGFKVAHLADEDHFGSLTKSGAQCRRKVARIMPDLTLVDSGSLVQVQILDRILDGDDVVVLLFVDDVDDGGLRGALARAGRTSYQHQAIAKLGDITQLRRQTERLERRNVSWDNPHDNRIDATLLKYVDAKTRSGR